jgi:hypothetical protein
MKEELKFCTGIRLALKEATNKKKERGATAKALR